LTLFADKMHLAESDPFNSLAKPLISVAIVVVAGALAAYFKGKSK
jgi:hypothetical protein